MHPSVTLNTAKFWTTICQRISTKHDFFFLKKAQFNAQQISGWGKNEIKVFNIILSVSATLLYERNCCHGKKYCLDTAPRSEVRCSSLVSQPHSSARSWGFLENGGRLKNFIYFLINENRWECSNLYNQHKQTRT